MISEPSAAAYVAFAPPQSRNVSDQENHMTELDNALAGSHCIISVMGSHAGEDADVIFERKKADIQAVGMSFWLIRSPKARPADVQKMCSTFSGYTIFIEPSTKGGARPTTELNPAKEFSRDRNLWNRIPNGIGPVTGKLDSGATALVFETLTTSKGGMLDLWDYSDYSDINKPLKIILGCSTICAARRKSKAEEERMKSRYRKIVAIARMKEPYCVWVR